MGSRRTLIMLAAVTLAAAAAGTTFLYMRGLERAAFGGAELVEVFVVVKDVPKGTPGETAIAQEAVAADSAPRKYRPGNALTTLDSIKGRVALVDLKVDTILTDGHFVEPRAAQVTFSQRIPAGNVAITVSVDQVRGVAGLLVPGDKVNILVNDGTAQRVLFQNVLVIAIGTTAAPQAGETEAVTNPGSGLITFAVPPEAASRIVLASQQGGGLYLALVPQDNVPAPVLPVTPNNLFPTNLTP